LRQVHSDAQTAFRLPTDDFVEERRREDRGNGDRDENKERKREYKGSRKTDASEATG
jgi:hypothetical protein